MDDLIAQLETATEGSRESAWQPIETAPKDGTKVDLLYPYPRGRAINCFWEERHLAWVWRKATWKEGDLLPEDQWDWGYYANMEPTHWMPRPAPPKDAST